MVFLLSVLNFRKVLRGVGAGKLNFQNSVHFCLFGRLNATIDSLDYEVIACEQFSDPIIVV